MEVLCPAGCPNFTTDLWGITKPILSPILSEGSYFLSGREQAKTYPLFFPFWDLLGYSRFLSDSWVWRGADHYSWMFGPLQVPGPEPSVVPKEDQMEVVFAGSGNGDFHDGEGCRLMALGLRRKTPVLPADLQFGNRVSVLTVVSTWAGRAQASWQHQEGQGQGQTDMGTTAGGKAKSNNGNVHTSTVPRVSKTVL